MKQVKPSAWNGHFAIVEYDTETGAERRQEITAEEWKWTQAAAPDIKEMRRRFIELAASYGLRHDATPPRTKSLWGAWDEKHGDK